MAATSLLTSPCQMQIEREHGRVRELHRDIPEFVKWYGSWWIQSADPAGWLRITDAHLASRLDRIKIRFDIAEDLACAPARHGDEQPAHDGDDQAPKTPWPPW